MTHTLTEIWGEPATGKSHAAHSGWPDPLHVDTAYTDMGFREIEIDGRGETGETWPIVRKLADDPQSAYHYLSGWPQDGLDVPSGAKTVIIDNAPDLRVLAANEWCARNDSDWPPQQAWGAINDMVDGLLRDLTHQAHVVVVSQKKAEYQDGDKTGERTRDGPKRMEYKADFRVELTIDDENTRHALMHKNRYMDMTNLPERPHDLGGSVGLDDLAAIAGMGVEEL